MESEAIAQPEQPLRIEDDPQKGRYQVWLGDEFAAYSEYENEPGRIVFTHTVVRPKFEGRGIGSEFRPGLGLSSMRSRVEQAGGHFRITPNTPRGTLIEARLPRSDREVNHS